VVLVDGDEAAEFFVDERALEHRLASAAGAAR
jgi:hypothetical protein